jgi:hypothetical protein|tara:strand:- start:158 stop:688 length:531 start_codon:yes stop_codon:yes gene_type:complete
MSDSDKVKRKLITQLSTIDPDTGEELSSIERERLFPNVVRIDKERFYKVWPRAIDTIDDKHMYKFIKLLTFLEGPNQRLSYSKQGEEPIPIKKIHMARELHVDPKTIRCFIKDMIDIKGYFMFDGHFYVNPSFATRTRDIHTKYIFEMLRMDPVIKDYIPKYEKNILDFFKRSSKL